VAVSLTVMAMPMQAPTQHWWSNLCAGEAEDRLVPHVLELHELLEPPPAERVQPPRLLVALLILPVAAQGKFLAGASSCNPLPDRLRVVAGVRQTIRRATLAYQGGFCTAIPTHCSYFTSA